MAKPSSSLQEGHQNPEPSEHHPPHSHHARLPVIPDLRFEYSYLRSIRPYVKFQSTTPEPHQKQGLGNLLSGERYENVDGHEEEHELSLVQNQSSTEVIELQWGRIAWVTTRDQVISPLLQGALWALASYLFTPFSAQLGSRVGTFARSRLTPPTEGLGVGWLRNLANGLGFGTTGPSTSTRRT
ncbi:hypothetical protein BDZ94DRAFT_1198624 [Collybia nuda]|uniref:Uncharacterized protein n=1 Tax=Collybia nuda TaxID=64659 RepID=A0A9P6CGK9_9AGAR|nr:hypothetical protein BDZ94DRAFT_1198624 [Collybia nuda]